MSKAHRGSRLLTKDTIYSVPYSTAHFNYNEDLIGIQYGDAIYPYGSTNVSLVDGKMGRALSLQPGSFLYYPGNIFNKSAGCISCWIFNQSNSIAGAFRRIISFVGTVTSVDNNRDINFDMYNNTPRYKAIINGAEISFLSDNDLIVGQWNHVAFSWGTDGMHLVVNGNVTSNYSLTTGIASIATNVSVGVNQDSSQSYLYGLIEELRIDKFQPDIEEIQAWYHSDAPFYNPHDYRGYAY